MSDPDKAALRAGLRALRDSFLLAMPPGERERLEARAAAFLAPLISGARCVAFYRAVGSEIGCGPAMAVTEASRIAVALPHVMPDGSAMDFRAWRAGEPLEAGWRGLRQPGAGAPIIEPDIIIVPMLGFDSSLMRIGQGGGFYDRALDTRPGVKKIGFAWSVQQLPAVPVDPWDQRLDRIVTERGVIEGNSRP